MSATVHDEVQSGSREPLHHAVAGWRVHPFDTASLEPSFLLESGDGRRWEVNAATARCVEGLAAGEPLDLLAARLTDEFKQELTAESLREHVDRTLSGMGVTVGGADEPSQQYRPRRGTMRYVSIRRTLFAADLVAPLTHRLAALFDPRRFWWHAAIVATLTAIAVWVAAKQPGPALAVLFTPTALVILLVSGFIHELGHGAACKRFGARHGALGAGMYLVFPVLYMELDDAWRLRRTERAVVDAGGLYLQLLFGLLVAAAAVLWTPLRPAATAVVTVLGFGALLNLNPLFRFDGYWLVSDLLGVPNLRERSLRAISGTWQQLRGRRAQEGAGASPALPPWIAHALVAYGIGSLAFFGYWSRSIASYLWRVPVELTVGVESAVGVAGEALGDGRIWEAFVAFGPFILPALTLLGAVLAVALLLEQLGRAALRRARSAWRPRLRTAGAHRAAELPALAIRPSSDAAHSSEVPATVAREGQDTATVRVLIGWVQPAEAQLWLAERKETHRDLPQHAARAAAARAAVALRSPRPRARDVLRDVLREPESELAAHEARLHEARTADAYFREGWRIVFVDLHQLTVAQVHLYHAYAASLMAGVGTNATQLAELTLPLTMPRFPSPVFDDRRQAWVLTSADPNLAVSRSYKSTGGGGEQSFGFTVRLRPSFASVAEFDGQYILRDGYHRALGAYLHGIRWLPVFVKALSSFEAMGLPNGFLGERELLSERPPRLADYFDDRVAAEVRMAPPRKTIVVQALDLLTVE